MYNLGKVLSKRRVMVTGMLVYLLLAYFVYHALHGDRGIFSYLRLSQELEEKREKLSVLKEERTLLEQRVSLVRTNSIDLDILDELARKNLGLIGKDEFVIIMERSNEKHGSQLNIQEKQE